jgi:hypothetical protein
MFEPVNDLEKSLMNAATNPAARPQFSRDILDSDIYIINARDDQLNIQNNVLQAGSQLNIQSFERNGQSWLPIFTSLQHLREYIRADVNYLQMRGRDFFEITRGAYVMLNPGFPCGKEFFPEEIQQMLDRSIFQPVKTYTAQKDTQVLIGQPALYPTQLVKALSSYFAKNPLVSKAYLALMSNPEEEKPHLLIAIDGKGDWQKMIGDAGVIASGAVGKGEVIDFMQINNSSLSKTVMRQSRPFYEKSLLKKLFG